MYNGHLYRVTFHYSEDDKVERLHAWFATHNENFLAGMIQEVWPNSKYTYYRYTTEYPVVMQQVGNLYGFPIYLAGKINKADYPED